MTSAAIIDTQTDAEDQPIDAGRREDRPEILRINIQKTKLLKVNNMQQCKVQIKVKDVDEDNKFTYLGSACSERQRRNR